MKTKALAMLLSLLFLAGSGGYYQHSLENGRLVFVQAFPEGVAVTLSAQEAGLLVAYYTETELLFSELLPMNAQPETLSVQVCGDALQIFVNYPASIPGQVETMAAERFVVSLPRAQACTNNSYLPIVFMEQ